MPNKLKFIVLALLFLGFGCKTEFFPSEQGAELLGEGQRSSLVRPNFNVVTTSTVQQGLYPDTDLGAELGTTSLRFSNAFIGGVLTVGSCTGCGGSSGSGIDDWDFINATTIAPSSTVGIAIATSTTDRLGKFYVDVSGNVSVSGTLRLGDATSGTIRTSDLIVTDRSENRIGNFTYSGGIGSIWRFNNTGLRLRDSSDAEIVSVTAGNPWTFTSNISAVQFQQNANPLTNALYDLGTTSTKWRYGNFSSGLVVDTSTASSTLDATTLTVNKATGFNNGRFDVDSSGNISASGTIKFGSAQTPPVGVFSVGQDASNRMYSYTPTGRTWVWTNQGTGDIMTLSNGGNLVVVGTLTMSVGSRQNSNNALTFGPVTDTNAHSFWDITTAFYTTHAMVASLGANSNQFIIGKNGNQVVNSGLAAQTDPSIILQPGTYTASGKQLMILAQGSTGSASGTIRTVGTPIQLVSGSSTIWMSNSGSIYTTSSIAATSTNSGGVEYFVKNSGGGCTKWYFNAAHQVVSGDCGANTVTTTF